MVAVGGGKEGSLAKVLGKLIGGQVIEGAVGNVLAGLVGNVVGHGKRSAQNLKGVEAKAIALVLNAQVGQTQARSLTVQAGKRGDGILRERLVEGAAFFTWSRLMIPKCLSSLLGIVLPAHWILSAIR